LLIIFTPEENREMKKSLIIFFVLLNLAVASASFQLANYSIQTSYGKGDSLKGWMNISISSEFVNSLISSNMDGSIKIIDLFRNSSQSFTCIPDDCLTNYAPSNPETQKSYTLNIGEEKIFGLVLNGIIDGVGDANFDVEGNNAPSCINPLEIDILNDDSVDFVSNTTTDDFSCRSEYEKGCFNSSSVLTEVGLGKTPFCEKIRLPPAEKFRLTTWLKKDDSSSNPDDNIKMVLYSSEGILKKSCDLPVPSSSGGNVYCDVTYSNKKSADYFVCVKAENQQLTKYKARRETVEPCGFYGAPTGSNAYNYDYDISAVGARYATSGKIKISGLKSYIQGYLTRFNNCTTGCTIPIKITSYASSMNIKISNLSLNYISGGAVTDNTLYDVSEENAKMSAAYSMLNLDKSNINITGSYGTKSFILELNGNNIFTKSINISDVISITSLNRYNVPAAVATKLVVNTEIPSGRNITRYAWNFGDESTEISTVNNSIKHAYPSIGIYTLSVTIEDNLGNIVSKSFDIEAVSPENFVNSTIQDYKIRLNNITNQIALLPAAYKSNIEKMINTSTIQDSVNSLEQEYLAAVSDDDYISIMTQLSNLKIPYSVRTTNKGIMPFFVEPGKINLANLKALGAGDFNSDEQESVAAWNQDNLNMNLDFNSISADYDEGTENLIWIYQLKLTNKNSYSGELYVVIEPDAEISNSKAVENGVGVSYSSLPSEIDFSSSASFNEIVIYLSPKESKLEYVKSSACVPDGVCDKENGENTSNCREDCKPWGWATFWIILVLIFGIAAYILLQWWYTVRYETYLFKNRNDVFNLMTSIKNARSQGIKDGEIKSKLKSAGWSGEKISYIFKKIDGKAIMPFAFINFARKKENRYPINNLRQGL